ncbi:MAG: methyltransferase domain-containing protein [Parcubacteria group bacterium]|jgi:2-polyprenyl-3-methyl-5-hydroxy-6-metoxy-1,4-benzoquinol methylase
MDHAFFLTREMYSESLQDDSLDKLRRAFRKIDTEIGLWYARHLGLTASEHWSRRFELPWAFCEALPITGKSCLDVGSGFSPLPVLLADNCRRALSLDIKPSSHLRAVLLHHRGQSVQADLREYTPDELFDRVFCISVLEHVERIDIVAGLQRMRSWLSPGGRLIVTMDVRLPGCLCGVPINTLVRLARSFGIAVEVSGNLLSSSDFDNEGQYVGEDIGVFCMVLEECNGKRASEVQS